MRKLPPLNAVRAFEAVARHVSFTNAATELHVTHGAVSRQVALLEEWLGTPLFRRAPSQLALTPAGRAFASEATAMLDRLALAAQQVQQAGMPTILRVSAPPTFTMRWLIPRLSGFQRRHADIEIRLTTSLEPLNLLRHGHDLAVRSFSEPPSGHRFEQLVVETFVPVCDAGLARRTGLATPQDLASHTLIRYGTEFHPWEDWLEQAGVPQLQPAGWLDFEHMFFALQAAAEGLGVVLLPLYLVLDDLIAQRLCAPFGGLGAAERGCYLCMDPSPNADPAVGAFRNWLVHEGRDTNSSVQAWQHTLEGAS